LVRLRLREPLASSLLAAVESRRRDLTRLADSVPWHQPWPDPAAPPSLLAVRAFCVRCRRAPAWVGLLSLIEEYVAVWDNPAAMPGRPSAQVEIFNRDGWRCMAPGCTSRRHLHGHHLRYRSHHGGDESANRVPLCRFHHLRGEHGELASCSGRAPLDIVWALGRWDVVTRYRNERFLLVGGESGSAGQLRRRRPKPAEGHETASGQDGARNRSGNKAFARKLLRVGS
jgi:hypothetical protein